MLEKAKSGIIIDSAQRLEKVLKNRQEIPVPREVLKRQKIFDVTYFSFDEKLHQGQLVMDTNVISDIRKVFNLIRKIKFPIRTVIPFVDRSAMSKEEVLATLNNSSAFNYRLIRGSNILSNHAFGRAIDINPFLNPFIDGNHVLPEGARYDPKASGTLLANGNVVVCFKKMGWVWGGDWKDKKDYMHFEKSY